MADVEGSLTFLPVLGVGDCKVALMGAHALHYEVVNYNGKQENSH